MEKSLAQISRIKELQVNLNSQLENLNLKSSENYLSETLNTAKEIEKQLIILSYLLENTEVIEQFSAEVTTQKIEKNHFPPEKQINNEEVTEPIENKAISENNTSSNNLEKYDSIAEQNSTSPNIDEKEMTKKQEALADKFMKKGINKISENIGISEKFLFIHELFKGDTERYIKELNQLDAAVTVQEAEQVLDKLTTEFNWNIEAHAYLELKKLIDRKHPVI